MDEEEEDVKDIRRENREKATKREIKKDAPSSSQPKFVKEMTTSNLDRGKTPSEERPTTSRATRVKFYPKQSEDFTVAHKQVITVPTEHLLLQVANQSTGSSGFVTKTKKNSAKTHFKPQSTFYQHNSTSHVRNGSKASETHTLPPLGNHFLS